MSDLALQMGSEPTLGLVMLGGLVVLALLDSLSFGTLLIPVWLLMAPGGVRWGRVGVYLATIGTFYFAVGLVLLFAADAITPLARSLAGTQLWNWGLLAAGVLLCAWSFVLDARSKRRAGPSGTFTRWRTKAMGDQRGVAAHAPMVVLAISAAGVEVASMLPYLAAIGIISAADPGTAQATVVLAGYCLVMLSPAIVLCVVRLVAAGMMRAPLARLEAWMTKNAAGATSWIVGALGFILALNAASELGIV